MTEPISKLNEYEVAEAARILICQEVATQLAVAQNYFQAQLEQLAGKFIQACQLLEERGQLECKLIEDRAKFELGEIIKAVRDGADS